MHKNIIGVISIEHNQNFLTGRYFRDILTSVNQHAAEHNCYVYTIACTNEQIENPGIFQAFATQHITAALLIAPNLAFLDANHDFLQEIPSVIISTPRLQTTLNYVNSNHYQALCQMVEHLAALGHQRIRFLQPPGDSGDYPERARGYLDTVTRLCLKPDIITATYPLSEEQVEREILADLPDALIATDDLDALELLSRLQRRGLRVPDNLALVGFDDEEFAAHTFPALTTVSQPLQQMAHHAVRVLVAQLSGERMHVYQEVLPNRLIIRESCGA